MDARIGPVRLPAIQVRLRRLERLEAQALQRRLLRVADAGFDLPFAIGIAHAARQRDDAVMREHVAIERIERRIVNIRGEDALAKIVEHDDLDRAAEPAKRAFVQLRPDLRARSPRQQPHRLARVAQSEHEQAHAAVLPGLRVAHHRALAVVGLAFLPGGGGDHHARLGRRAAAQRQHEPSDTGVACGESVIVDEVLPDGHGVAATGQGLGNHLTVWLAGTRTRRAPGSETVAQGRWTPSR